jgi:hypothetical protein
MKSTIPINNTNITIRPSSLNTFFGCPYQWARVFLSGEMTIPNSRAVIGTAIHAGVEKIWIDAMKSKDKDDINLGAAKDAAAGEFKAEIEKAGINYGDNETFNTSVNEIVNGVEAFVDDIYPFVDIPHAVEQRYTMPIDHQLVKELSGTLDYIGEDQADVKTSKRASTGTKTYCIQQSLYKILAEYNGVPVNNIYIHGIILTKQPTGQILKMEPDIARAKYVFNNLLDTLDLLAEDKVKPETIFRGNPGYMFCSNKYCNLYNTCPFVNGEDVDKKSAQVVKL